MVQLTIHARVEIDYKTSSGAYLSRSVWHKAARTLCLVRVNGTWIACTTSGFESSVRKEEKVSKIDFHHAQCIRKRINNRHAQQVDDPREYYSVRLFFVTNWKVGSMFAVLWPEDAPWVRRRQQSRRASLRQKHWWLQSTIAGYCAWSGRGRYVQHTVITAPISDGHVYHGT